MARVCVDANVVVTRLIPDEHNEQVEALWSQWLQEQDDLFGPPLLYDEVPSVLRQAVFSGRVTPEEGDLAFDTFCDMDIALSTTGDLHIAAWRLAKLHRLPTVYDAIYLAAAQAEDCELWTLDRRLFNAVSLPWVRWAGEVRGRPQN